MRGVIVIDSLERAFAEITRLSEEQQEAFAQWILEELRDEQRWENAFATSLDKLDALGAKALEEYRAGKTEALDPDLLE